MNIIAAIGSGKRFYRKKRPFDGPIIQMKKNSGDGTVYDFNSIVYEDGSNYLISVEDILSDEWEMMI